MTELFEILTGLVDALVGLVDACFPLAGGGCALALSVAATTGNDANGGMMAIVRQWYGRNDERFANVVNFFNTLQSRKGLQPLAWLPAMKIDLDRLRVLMNKCNAKTSSPQEIIARHALLGKLVKQCLSDGKTYVLAMHKRGLLTAEEVHSLGFLTPREADERRERPAPTRALARCKVKVVNMNCVEIVIDKSTSENATRIRDAWPEGVKQAVIVITADDGETKIYHQMTSRLHNLIQMPEGSHGKQFSATAAFLKHVDDAPVFGNSEVFSMPLTIDELVAEHEHREYDIYEQIDRMKAEIAKAKKAREQ
jgi:hypothetical protein